MNRLLLAIARWLRRRRKRQIARIARTDPERAEFERLRDAVHRAEVVNRRLKARLRRAEREGRE